jgi:hypothetical protein
MIFLTVVTPDGLRAAVKIPEGILVLDKIQPNNEPLPLTLEEALL